MSNAQVCTDPSCKGGVHLSSHQNSSNRVLPCKVCRVYKTRREANERVQKLLAMYVAEQAARGGSPDDVLDRLAESPDMLVEALKRVAELEAQLAATDDVLGSYREFHTEYEVDEMPRNGHVCQVVSRVPDTDARAVTFGSSDQAGVKGGARTSEYKGRKSWDVRVRAVCRHQEVRGETYETHPNARCPECGYRCGSLWKYK